LKIIQNDKQKQQYLNKFVQMLNEEDTSYSKYIKIVTFEKGEHIYYEGDEVNMIIAPSSEDGEIAIIDYCNPGSMLGDLEYFSHDNIYHDCIAASTSIFVSIKYQYVESYFSKKNSFNYFLAKSLADKLKSASFKQSSNMLYPFDKRLANYILDLSTIHDINEVSIDTSTIAQYFGVTDRHYRRTLAKFEQLRMVKRDNKKIIILNRELLEHYGENK